MNQIADQAAPTTMQKLSSLWGQYLPLSLSDVTMALGDPLIVFTLAQMPNARMNLAAVGIAKAIAVFFESPVIMMLHASNSLAANQESREGLWKLMVIAALTLVGLLTVLSFPGVFAVMNRYFFATEAAIAFHSREILSLLILWPGAIAWRRYYQGLLIHRGNVQVVKNASLVRLAFVILMLFTGYNLEFSGALLAGATLMGGVLVESATVSLAYYRRYGRVTPVVSTELTPKAKLLPTTLQGIWSFYWPLANSMVVVWGGRALLLGIVARSVDAAVALAAWPAAWGLVLVIANATRMVQQVVIRNRGEMSDPFLLFFAGTVGLLFFAILVLMANTTVGYRLTQSFIGNDPDLLTGVLPVLFLCSAVPLLVALQNAIQGFLISEGRTGRVNVATWLGTTFLLSVTAGAIYFGFAGATAASFAMLTALLVETFWLARGLPSNFFRSSSSRAERSEVEGSPA